MVSIAVSNSAALNYFSSSEEWQLTPNTTVKLKAFNRNWNTCIYELFCRGVYVSDRTITSKLLQIISTFFLLGSYVDWKKIMDEFAWRDRMSKSSQDHFSEVQEVYDFLLGVAGSELPSPMTLFSSLFIFYLLRNRKFWQQKFCCCGFAFVERFATGRQLWTVRRAEATLLRAICQR